MFFEEQKDPNIIFSDVNLSLDEKIICIKKLLSNRNNDGIMIKIEKLLTQNINSNLSSIEKMLVVEKFSYCGNAMMNFKTINWINYTSIELYWKLYKLLPNTEFKFKLQIIYFLLRNEIQEFIKREILNELRIFSNIITTIQISNADFGNFIDLLLHSGEIELENIGRTLLIVLRNRELGNTYRQPMIKNIYNDTQNVHDSDINSSVLEALTILSGDIHREEYKYKILGQDSFEIVEIVRNKIIDEYKGSEKRKINDSINRILVDLAFFSKQKLRLRDILQRVWNRIMNMMNSESSKEAIKRLTQELVDMHDLCSTGHMSRIINVLSGFSEENGGLTVVKISWNNQIKSNISARINFRIKNNENSDSLLESMIETENSKRECYVNFVKSIRDDIFIELEKEFSPTFNKDFNKDTFISLFNSNYILFES
jgi:hypothetical protein